MSYPVKQALLRLGHKVSQAGKQSDGYRLGGLLVDGVWSHRCKNVFYFFTILFKKTRFNVFLFSRTFYFLVVNFFYPTKSYKILLKLINSCIKRLLGDGFNMAELYKNSLLKSRT